MRKLPSVSEMEHITSKEFGENMDTILDRVVAEDIALIIDHESKSYVLCPARWFDLLELPHLELMIKNAVRYVAGVDSTDLQQTHDMLRELLPALSDECILQLIELIRGKSVDSDNKQWLDMELLLKAALPQTEKEDKETS